jgi:hypothetical protein
MRKTTRPYLKLIDKAPEPEPVAPIPASSPPIVGLLVVAVVTGVYGFIAGFLVGKVYF